MAIRRSDNGSRFSQKSDMPNGMASLRSSATVSTLPTVKAMRDCFERYLSLRIANGNASLDTLKTYRSRVSQFLAWCKKQELYPALVTQQNMLEYRKCLVDEGKQSSTIRLSLVVLGHFYQACLGEMLVQKNPARDVKPPRERREVGSSINYLSEEELQLLIDSVEAVNKTPGKSVSLVQLLRDRLLLGLMGLQGCRCIELYRANLHDVNSAQGQYQLRLDGKNSIRTIILRPDIAADIVQYRQARTSEVEKLSANSPLFISLSNRRYGQRLSRSGIGKVIDKYLEKCNLKHIGFNRQLTPYSLRHTAATLSLEGGSSLREVQDFLGHADPKTTAIYTHVLSSQENNPAAKIKIDY